MNCVLIPTLIIVFLIGIKSTSICSNEKFTAKDMDSVFLRSTPAGGVHAGTYLKDESASSLPECVLSCCNDNKCNIALMLGKSCLLVHCNASVIGGCEPKTRLGARFNDTVMITLRNTSETMEASSPVIRPTEMAEERPQDVTCIYGLSMCVQHEICYLSNDRRKQGVCVCVEGYSRDKTGWCVDATTAPTTATATTTTTTTTTSVQLQALSSTEANTTVGDVTTSVAPSAKNHRPSDITCIYGLMVCLEHEECTLSNNRRKQGVCSCVGDYERDPETKWCVHTNQTSTVMNTTNITSHTTTAATQFKTLSTKKDEIMHTTKPSLIVLKVSAGVNKVLQLPENQIKLSAYVVPKAAKKKKVPTATLR